MPKWPGPLSFDNQADPEPIIAPAERRLLAGEVADKIREAIMTGVLSPGQRIREEHLASILGVSRGPVREALVQLEREGLVVKLPNRATIVARLTPEDAEEVYSLRLALERLAITRLISRAEETDMARLQDIVQIMDQAVQRGVSPHMAAELDMQFHETMVSLSHHRRLQEAWNTLKSQTQILLLSRNAANLDFPHLLTQSHQDIVDVVRSRDVLKATKLMEHHLWGSYVRVLQGQSAAVPEPPPFIQP